jgi:hypothetical protein
VWDGDLNAVVAVVDIVASDLRGDDQDKWEVGCSWSMQWWRLSIELCAYEQLEDGCYGWTACIEGYVIVDHVHTTRCIRSQWMMRNRESFCSRWEAVKWSIKKVIV